MVYGTISTGRENMGKRTLVHSAEKTPSSKPVGRQRPDPAEISRILKIPLRVLVRTHKNKNFNGRIPDVDELRYPFEDVVIWGATARILHHFIELLLEVVTPD